MLSETQLSGDFVPTNGRSSSDRFGVPTACSLQVFGCSFVSPAGQVAPLDLLSGEKSTNPPHMIQPRRSALITLEIMCTIMTRMTTTTTTTFRREPNLNDGHDGVCDDDDDDDDGWYQMHLIHSINLLFTHLIDTTSSPSTRLAYRIVCEAHPGRFVIANEFFLYSKTSIGSNWRAPLLVSLVNLMILTIIWFPSSIHTATTTSGGQFGT